MTDVLIIFGSKSDEGVYKPIQNMLDGEGISNEVRILSAHRNPDEVTKLIKNSEHKIIIAGAGLAAHLPGVVASKTIKPVIGVPCEGNFSGLDAFLSIVQMPKGIPVLSTGVDCSEEAAMFAAKCLKKYIGINLVIGGNTNKRINTAKEMLESLGIDYTTDDIKEDCVNVIFAEMDGAKSSSDLMTINVPLKEGSKPEDSLTLMKLAESGIWVGLNRAENAALAAVQIMNISVDYSKILLAHKEKISGNA